MDGGWEGEEGMGGKEQGRGREEQDATRTDALQPFLSFGRMKVGQAAVRDGSRSEAFDHLHR